MLCVCIDSQKAVCTYNSHTENLQFSYRNEITFSNPGMPLILAPWSTKSLMMSKWPAQTAILRGVFPSMHLQSILADCSKRYSQIL